MPLLCSQSPRVVADKNLVVSTTGRMNGGVSPFYIGRWLDRVGLRIDFLDFWQAAARGEGFLRAGQ